jgi:hypothetical protein
MTGTVAPARKSHVSPESGSVHRSAIAGGYRFVTSPEASK